MTFVCTYIDSSDQHEDVLNIDQYCARYILVLAACVCGEPFYHVRDNVATSKNFQHTQRPFELGETDTSSLSLCNCIG